VLNSVHSTKSIWDRGCRRERFALLLAFALTLLTSHSAQGQTFSVLHNFTGGSDGAGPYAGLTLDGAGNLYGTASTGGFSGGDCGTGCGVVYKLRPVHSAWLFTPIYSFQGHANQDGEQPAARVVFGPDGALYGTTEYGGAGGACIDGCGTVYRLTPAATVCKTALCPWTETILHSFGLSDGVSPGSGDVAFDASGNLYGTTIQGGGYMSDCLEYGCGVAYEISPSNGGWYTNVIYEFASGSTNTPFSGFIFDSWGNLYGTTSSGGEAGFGSVYELSLVDGLWSQTVLYSFLNESDGAGPEAGLVADGSGNYYGATTFGGVNGGGTIFELSPVGDGWSYSVLYSFTGHRGTSATLTMSAAGNLYGTTESDGSNRLGNIFQLTRTNGSWTYTSLHDFTGGADGAYPASNVVLDSNGNLYGTAAGGGIASDCGGNGCGVVWEITP